VPKLNTRRALGLVESIVYATTKRKGARVPIVDSDFQRIGGRHRFGVTTEIDRYMNIFVLISVNLSFHELTVKYYY
jgi:hypothetical protein